MKLIAFLLRSSGRMVALAIVTGFLSGGSSAALIALISRAVGRSGSLTPLLLGFVGLALTAAVTSFLSQVVLIRLSQQAVYQLRLHLSRQILATELSQLEQLGASRLLATLTDDVQSITTAVQVMPFLCIDAAIVIGCFSYLAWLYASALVWVIGVIVIGVGSCQWLLSRARKIMTLVREEQDQLYRHFRSLTDGIKELKLHQQRQQDFLQNDLNHSAANYQRYHVRSLTLFAITSSWGQFTLFFVIGVVLFALPNLIQITPQTLAGYVLTFIYLMLPINNLLFNLPSLSRASVALQKIKSLGLTLNQKLEPNSASTAIVADWQQLILQDVTHTYRTEDSQFTLGPIDLEFQPGEVVFIVGGNGSGKSTLAKLITGLYIPETGKIVFDGQPIENANRIWYRQHFSVIFSDFYLFDRLLGVANDPQAQTYLKRLQLEHKVKIVDGKLSTTALSQGQRKRLALLTAYLEDRPIYLFDEWAADQDPTFKEVFYRELLPELRDRGKAVLVISHDDHYFHLGDRIIKLDYGQIEYDKRVKG
ncbi:MAG: cyclic peptide export ABC transporter [Cyanobacteria bacterium RM1_2_2]|nr:cyclic peptide export ABC transporter [Cyanobacteria bacterium RM1_2_2]